MPRAKPTAIDAEAVRRIAAAFKINLPPPPPTKAATQAARRMFERLRRAYQLRLAHRKLRRLPRRKDKEFADWLAAAKDRCSRLVCRIDDPGYPHDDPHWTPCANCGLYPLDPKHKRKI